MRRKGRQPPKKHRKRRRSEASLAALSESHSGERAEESAEESGDVGRSSRITSPIDADELSALVERSNPEDDVVAGEPPDLVGDLPRLAPTMPRTRSSTDFSAFGGGITDALVAVTGDHPSVGVPRQRRGTLGESKRDQAAQDAVQTPAAAPTGQRERGLLAMALALEAQGSLEAALSPCAAAIAADPSDQEARQLRDRLYHALVPAMQQRIDTLEQVPALLVEPTKITWHKLDHQAGLLLSRIDGVLSYGELLGVGGMPTFETLRTLLKLLELKLIGHEAAPSDPRPKP